MLLVYPYFQHNDSYSATKAEGEALVLKANGINGLLTCCIRPSSIFGPGDRLLVPSLVTAARAGKSKVIGNSHILFNVFNYYCIILWSDLYHFFPKHFGSRCVEDALWWHLFSVFIYLFIYLNKHPLKKISLSRTPRLSGLILNTVFSHDQIELVF